MIQIRFATWRQAIRTAALLLTTLGITAAVLAQEAPPLETDGGAADTPAVTVPRSLVALTDTEAARLAPMTREIRDVLLRERDTLIALTARIAATRDDAEGFALQRELAAVKLRAEIDVMETQARYAQAAGHTDQAEKIRAALGPLAERAAKLPQAEEAKR